MVASTSASPIKNLFAYEISLYLRHACLHGRDITSSNNLVKQLTLSFYIYIRADMVEKCNANFIL
jgi:hypothetical protein